MRCLRGRPREKNWKKCATCWTNTKGKCDERICQLVFANRDAATGMGTRAFPVAGTGAGGAVVRGDDSLPQGFDSLRGGSGDAVADGGRADHHVYCALG